MSCALHALKEGLKVVVFDARGLCDGATGRNGGHQWPDPFLEPKTLELIQEDIKALGGFIESLSQEWQEKIDYHKIGGLDPFFTLEEVEEGDEDMETLKNCKLECEFSLTNNDPDLPEQATCGMIESQAAQMNPG